VSGNKSFEDITNSKQFVKTSFIAIPQIYCFKESFEQSVFRQSAVTSNLSLFLTRTQHSLPPSPISYVSIHFLSIIAFFLFLFTFLCPLCLSLLFLPFLLFLYLFSLSHLCLSHHFIFPFSLYFTYFSLSSLFFLFLSLLFILFLHFLFLISPNILFVTIQFLSEFFYISYVSSSMINFFALPLPSHSILSFFLSFFLSLNH